MTLAERSEVEKADWDESYQEELKRKAKAADDIAALWKKPGAVLMKTKGELVDFVAETLIAAGCDL